MNEEMRKEMDTFVSNTRDQVFPVIKKLAEGVKVDYQVLGGLVMRLSAPYLKQDQRNEIMEINKKAMAEYEKNKVEGK